MEQRQWTCPLVKREVSIDSQCHSSVVGGSRVTLSSRVDESVQVDLSATWDSDDEMVKRRSSLVVRNKKGHPIYSREDIREQYCINRKEVEVLENARSLKFLGCFPSNQDGGGVSPCTKRSLLFPCLHKKKHKVQQQQRRSSSDENLYNSPDRTFGSKELDLCSTDDDEYGFRKRPKTYYTEPDKETAYPLRYTGSRRKLESSASFGSQQSYYYGYDESDGELSLSINRPNQLSFAEKGQSDRFQNSRSVDELNDPSTTRRQRELSNRGSKTPDITLDDSRRHKHVSFDNGSLVRSNTVGGGLEEVGTTLKGGPVATSTPLNTQKRSFSPPPSRNHSEERLLDGCVMRTTPDWSVGDSRSTSTASMYRCQDSALSYRGMTPLPQRTRRALMKTQATQTEMTFKIRCTLPAYLTLSPRAQHRSHHRTSRHRTNRKIQSAHTTLGSDDSEEEVIQVDLVTQQQRLLRSGGSRVSIRRQRAVEEEVSFKGRAEPEIQTTKEVLIGERPVSRCAVEKRKVSSICREAALKSCEDVVETSVQEKINEKKPIEKTPPELPLPTLKQPISSEPSVLPLSKVHSVDGPSPEEVSEVSGTKSPSKRSAKGKLTETSSVKSSSESSKNLTNWISSSAEGSCSCPDYLSFDESQTETTEDSSLNPEIRQALETAERRRQECLEKYREVRKKSATSPDSESSSSHFTERETSRSEVSTSSSKGGLAKSETEDESSEYVTATDPSLQKSLVSSNRMSNKSSSPYVTAHTSTPEHGSPHLEALPPDDLESSDESTKKETPPTTPSTESDLGRTPLHHFPHDSGTPDSDRTSDVTALFDPSPEPCSSLQEPQTVIEIRSEATSEEILNDDELEEDSFPKAENGLLQDFESVKLRKANDDLSTVSEASEESSRLHKTRRKKSERGEVSSSSEYIPSETPDSTTSGSFVLENSCDTSSSKREMEGTKTKTESDTSESYKESKSSRTPQPTEETIKTASSPSDLSEKLVSLNLKGDVCSEGTIRPQRRKKDRIRNRSEPRAEHVSAFQFSRSKSRSPENKLSDDEGWGRCSHCGAPPRSAPPEWERRFWDHQPLMWRQHRDFVPYGRYSGGGSSFIPRSWSSETSTAPAMPIDVDMYSDEDEDAGVHSESYRMCSWIHISESDELAVWRQTTPPREEAEEGRLCRSDSTESTSSEHEFLRQYQMVTHRMIQRKCSLEMFKRISSRKFEIDKRVVVHKSNGEFGFRIHGNRPVVVSAIEKGTPAETCGLEVGDIIITINGLNVLDAPHGDVVRLAHSSGTAVLKLEVSRTCHVLAPSLTDPPSPPVYSGFLQRLSARRWCRRWFAVKLDGVLYWYRTTKEVDPLGALCLQNQSICRVSEAGAPHAFKVSKLGESPVFFAADDEDTATRWISALNQVASTASRVDPYVEECVRLAQLPPVSIPRVECAGPLAKYSKRKGWRRKYCLLKDASLYFYSNCNAKVALGLFQLHGYKVQSSSVHGQKNAFEAVPPEPRLKHLYFLADSENEKRRWLSALDYSIDRWIKIG